MRATFILTYIVTHMIHVQCTGGRGIERGGKKDGRKLGRGSSDFHNSYLFLEHLSTHCTLEL